MVTVLCVVAGLAQGVFSGSAVAAFLMALNLIPQLSGILYQRVVQPAGWALIVGVVCGTVGSMFPLSMGLPAWTAMIPGLFFGIFVGALAVAITEVLDAFPKLLARGGTAQLVVVFIIVMAIGKSLFSLIYWFFPLLH
ncbi:MAG: stage V sporulation protein AB [Christensenellales bacterium]|jgi:stage V sporulation protein AB